MPNSETMPTNCRKILNHIGATSKPAIAEQWFNKVNPHNGAIIAQVARSQKADIDLAVASAQKAWAGWSGMSAIKRGEILFELASLIKKHSADFAEIIQQETGKSIKDASGEVQAAVSQGYFMAGEGARLFGRTTSSSVANRYPLIIREPVGVAGLIIAANTPIANIAWKVFPALICGNTAVLKAAEDTPLTANFFAELAIQAGLPAGVLNVVQGLGSEAGAALVAHSDVNVISFTGSSLVGKKIALVAAERLAKVSLELGGKNALVVCDDADLDLAVKWALLSAFSNAGQRCASASRIIIFEKIYSAFKEQFCSAVRKLKIGNSDSDDFGPVINEKQLNNMLNQIAQVQKRGATLLTGGQRLTNSGFYLAPTVFENVAIADSFSQEELFGPVTCLYSAQDFNHALELTNQSAYGLTAAIHTKNFSRAVEFARRVASGVVMINAGTHGSEPHMPFGGLKLSGNGTREPGPEALDIYTNCKVIYENTLVSHL